MIRYFQPGKVSLKAFVLWDVLKIIIKGQLMQALPLLQGFKVFLC